VSQFHRTSCALLTLSSFAFALRASAQVDVWTHHNNNARTGANLDEKTLTTKNVTPAKFGKLFTIAVDGYVQAQPLYVSNVAMGGGTHNVLYVATEHGSVYALDAGTGKELWHDPPVEAAGTKAPAVIGNAIDAKAIFACDGRGYYKEMGPEIGIASTPVIDVAGKTLYCLLQSHSDNVIVPWSQTLHALDITTGAEREGWPVKIPSIVTSPGESARTFFLQFQNQRAALALGNGSVYICWGSFADCFCNVGGYNGYVMRFDTSLAGGAPGLTRTRGQTGAEYRLPETKGLQAVFCATPTSPMGLGGIWMTGSAPAIDANGDVYVSTGNGNVDVDYPNPRNFSDAILKLDGKTLAVKDYFTPSNFHVIEQGDFDLASAGVLLVPKTTLAIGSAKDGSVYLLDSADMGKYHADGDKIVQKIQASTNPMNCYNADGSIAGWGEGNHIMNSPVFYDAPRTGGAPRPTVYYSLAGESVAAFPMASGKLDPAHAVRSKESAPASYAGGAALSLSANADKPGTGILWAAMPLNAKPDPAWDAVPGVLRAFDAVTMKELWNSEANAARDGLGLYAKYTPPTIANGRVYASTFSNTVEVYGLLPNASGK
jgi:outer membrane protein assembly factor BamB